MKLPGIRPVGGENRASRVDLANCRWHSGHALAGLALAAVLAVSSCTGASLDGGGESDVAVLSVATMPPCELIGEGATEIKAGDGFFVLPGQVSITDQAGDKPDTIIVRPIMKWDGDRQAWIGYVAKPDASGTVATLAEAFELNGSTEVTYYLSESDRRAMMGGEEGEMPNYGALRKYDACSPSDLPRLVDASVVMVLFGEVIQNADGRTMVSFGQKLAEQIAATNGYYGDVYAGVVGGEFPAP